METKQIEAKEKEYGEVLMNARKLQEVRDDLLKKRKSFSKADLSRLEKLIPESADNVKLVMELQNIASKYGLSIQSASSEKDDGLTKKKGRNRKVNFDIQTKDYGTITLSFTITGPYQSFLSFLKDVEDNIRITDVKDLTISPVDNGSGYQYDISLETYWVKDNI